MIKSLRWGWLFVGSPRNRVAQIRRAPGELRRLLLVGLALVGWYALAAQALVELREYEASLGLDSMGSLDSQSVRR